MDFDHSQGTVSINGKTVNPMPRADASHSQRQQPRSDKPSGGGRTHCDQDVFRLAGVRLHIVELVGKFVSGFARKHLKYTHCGVRITRAAEFAVHLEP